MPVVDFRFLYSFLPGDGETVSLPCCPRAESQPPKGLEVSSPFSDLGIHSIPPHVVDSSACLSHAWSSTGHHEPKSHTDVCVPRPPLFHPGFLSTNLRSMR